MFAVMFYGECYRHGLTRKSPEISCKKKRGIGVYGYVFATEIMVLVVLINPKALNTIGNAFVAMNAVMRGLCRALFCIL